ncbi:hypothetical protein NMY22_g16814 [Coprinellus aureogranulatus]|nr:hypothetical protein NMY22_g16814 [Coprinellus aureogranulatus]
MLKDPQNRFNQPAKKSSDMAEIARSYHENLQNDTEHTPEARREATNEVLDQLDVRVGEDDKAKLGTYLEYNEVRDALMAMPNGKASGPDGIQAELWKNLVREHESSKEEDPEKKPPDVTLLLQLVYNDLERFGPRYGYNFAEGWMCPIYKKKDRDEIANYRPITVLNADYKIFTKALTQRLAPVALKLIHPDQAGFMAGRRIDDHTELIKLMIHWSEVENEDGLLVFLDQEKAYDRITHEFLLATLEKMDFPEHFRKQIKHLYANAETFVVINGVKSKTFRVVRGVRQGDPLSCLLFNLAIETLANMLRKSQLKGFSIPGSAERLITTLFADDTTVYLSKEDNFIDLQTILETWCRASGAKFNVDKTETIPIGTRTHRDRVVNTHQLRENDPLSNIPPNIKIAGQGEAVRALGAFVGNGIDDLSAWTSTIETMERKVRNWKKANTSLEGRSYITKLEPGGRTQYRTMVQGMPAHIEKQITDIVADIVWDGKPPAVNREVAALPYEKGGKAILHLPLRNDSIYLKLAQRFANDDARWVGLAKDIAFRDIPRSRKITDRDAATNTLLQTWDTAKQAARSSLPLSIRKMFEVARKYRLTFAPPMVTNTIKRELTLWYHPGRSCDYTTPNNGSYAECLRNNHLLYSVGDIEWFVENFPHPPVHLAPASSDESDFEDEPVTRPCECDKCSVTCAMGCKNPHKCHKVATEYLDSLYAKWHPKSNDPNLEEIISDYKTLREHDPPEDEHRFDPALDDFLEVKHGFRILDPLGPKTWKSISMDLKRPNLTDETWIDAHLGASTLGNNTMSCATFGAVIETTPPTNLQGKIPVNLPISHNNAVALGLIEILDTFGESGNIRIHLASKHMTDSLTNKLSHYEDTDWAYHDVDANLMRNLVSRLRTRSGLTNFKTYDKNSPHPSYPKAQSLAKQARSTTPKNPADYQAHNSDLLEGAKLSKLSQAQIYKILIREKAKNTKPRNDTVKKLGETRASIERRLGLKPPDEALWTSIRTNFIVPKKMQMHGNINSPLNRMPATGQGKIWELASELLERRGLTWPSKPKVGDILSCGFQIKKNARIGDNRLATIVISESAWLIWALRCRWVIDDEGAPNKEISPPEAANTWLKMINAKLTLDILASNEKRYRNKSIAKQLVTETWTQVVNDEDLLDRSARKHRNVGVLGTVEVSVTGFTPGGDRELGPRSTANPSLRLTPRAIVPFLPPISMPSYFQNAQKVVFQGTIINAAGNYVQHGPTMDPLQRCLSNITIGAMHNSQERSDAPKCHPETRVAVQEEIIGWIVNGDRDDCLKRVLWMTGPAGSGKTAIAGSIAELCKEKGLLAATFFFSSFSGSPGRSSKRRLIATIAYQLLQCAALEEVGKRILAVINKNPAIFGLRLKDQVEELILAPLRGARVHAVDATPWPKAIIIDGLDEAEPDHIDGVASDAQRARDEIHLEILSALLYAAHDPDFPFCIVVISRPERVIRFQSSNGR